MPQRTANRFACSDSRPRKGQPRKSVHNHRRANAVAQSYFNSFVELALDTSQGAIHARGRVVAAQTGMGMGIAFTAVSPEDFEKLSVVFLFANSNFCRRLYRLGG